MNRIKELNEELLEDMNTFGVNGEATCYINKETKLIEDYLVEPSKIKYLDEIIKKTTLFELFVNLVRFDYERAGRNLPIKSIIVKCLRNIKNMSQVNFAKFCNISVRNIEDWERGIQNIKLETLFEIAQKVGVNTHLIINAIEGFHL